MNKISNKNLAWIDVQNPTPQDILYLKDNFDLDPLVLDEFTSPSQRPRAEEFDNCLYVVMHIPLFDRKKRITTPGELDIVITKDHLFTAHIGENIPLKSIIKEFNENEVTKNLAMSESTGYLLYFILEKLLDSCFPKIDHINERLSEIEKEIFNEHEREMVQETSVMKRDILAFRRTLKPQRSILESLVQKHYNLLDDKLNKYFQELIGINIRVWNALENTKEVIESLEETNNALVSYKINEAMRFLTAVSLITFTLSVTVGVFAMTPFKSFGIVDERIAFFGVLLFMILTVILLLFFFRRKKWL